MTASTLHFKNPSRGGRHLLGCSAIRGLGSPWYFSLTHCHSRTALDVCWRDKSIKLLCGSKLCGSSYFKLHNTWYQPFAWRPAFVHYWSPSTSLQTSLSANGLSLVVPRTKLVEVLHKAPMHGGCLPLLCDKEASTIFNIIFGSQVVHGGEDVTTWPLKKNLYLQRDIFHMRPFCSVTHIQEFSSNIFTTT